MPLVYNNHPAFLVASSLGREAPGKRLVTAMNRIQEVIGHTKSLLSKLSRLCLVTEGYDRTVYVFANMKHKNVLLYSMFSDVWSYTSPPSD